MMESLFTVLFCFLFLFNCWGVMELIVLGVCTKYYQLGHILILRSALTSFTLFFFFYNHHHLLLFSKQPRCTTRVFFFCSTTTNSLNVCPKIKIRLIHGRKKKKVVIYVPTFTNNNLFHLGKDNCIIKYPKLMTIVSPLDTVVHPSASRSVAAN